MFDDFDDPPLEPLPLDTPANVDQVVQRIHEWPIELVLAVTGGGSAAITHLLQHGGGSKTLLDAQVPYSEPALVDFLGQLPEQFCSEATARAMAMAAWRRARSLTAAATHEPYLAGVACTASLASERPKRGPHRIHVAAQTESHTMVRSVELEKGARSRAEEEAVAAALILELIAQLCAVYAHNFECRPFVPLRPSEHAKDAHIEPTTIGSASSQVTSTRFRSTTSPTSNSAPLSSFPVPFIRFTKATDAWPSWRPSEPANPLPTKSP